MDADLIKPPLDVLHQLIEQHLTHRELNGLPDHSVASRLVEGKAGDLGCLTRMHWMIFSEKSDGGECSEWLWVLLRCRKSSIICARSAKRSFDLVAGRQWPGATWRHPNTRKLNLSHFLCYCPRWACVISYLSPAPTAPHLATRVCLYGFSFCRCRALQCPTSRPGAGRWSRRPGRPCRYSGI